MREILSALDDKLGPEDLDGIIAEIDTDGSGTVDFDGEFFLAKYPQCMYSLGTETQASYQEWNKNNLFVTREGLTEVEIHTVVWVITSCNNLVLTFQPRTRSQYILPNRWTAPNRLQHVLTQNAGI